MSAMQGDPRVGTQIQDYLIESFLGRGGQGVVYAARQVHLGRRVALKVLPPEVSRDPEFRDRFLREARLAASLEHPHVLPIYDAGEERGELFLAMRLVQGADLGDVLAREGPLGPERTMAIVTPVGGALDEAHEHGLVHRDVKPSNILLEPGPPGDRVFLSDFGLTKLYQPSDSSLAAPITRSGMFVGTPYYAAPEQIEGGNVDGRTDQYALACVLFECLTGTMPFRRPSEMAVLFAHVNDPPPRVSAVRAELPRGIDAVVQRGMAKDPAKRFEACSELVKAAGAALKGRRPRRTATGAAKPAAETDRSARSTTRTRAAAPPRPPSTEPATRVEPPPPPPPPPAAWPPPAASPSPPLGPSHPGLPAPSPAAPAEAPSYQPATAQEIRRRQRRARIWLVVILVGVGSVIAFNTLRGDGEGGAEPTADPRAGAAPTLVQTFRPWTDSGELQAGLVVFREDTGTCQIGSVRNKRADAWSCRTDGSVTVDPCFENPVDERRLACSTDPRTTDVILFDSRQPLPRENANAGDVEPGDWFLVLATDDVCTFVIGPSVIGSTEAVTFECALGVVIGDLDRTEPVWLAKLAPSASDETELRAIAEAWG